jgi:hypothetical protein
MQNRHIWASSSRILRRAFDIGICDFEQIIVLLRWLPMLVWWSIFHIYVTCKHNRKCGSNQLSEVAHGHPMLKTMIERYLGEEVLAVPRAVWIPLGSHAEKALLHLVELGYVDRQKVLAGLPHPSGANAERVAYFLGRKAADKLSSKTNGDRILAAKALLLRQVSLLRGEDGPG